MRDYGFTACSGLPSIAYRGFDQGKPVLDFTAADASMKLAQGAGVPGGEQLRRRCLGIQCLPSGHGRDGLGGFHGICAVRQGDLLAGPEARGPERWIPVYYNLADEPIGDDLVRAAENAEAYRRAFPKGPPYFTGASSFTGSDREDPHFRLAKALNVVSWNDHDEASVNLLHSAGSGLGLLQRREPLDLRHLHVQSGEAVRNEVPALVALERGCGRPLLRARLPGRRLRLVQHVAGRSSSFRRSSSSGCGKGWTIIGG